MLYQVPVQLFFLPKESISQNFLARFRPCQQFSNWSNKAICWCLNLQKLRADRTLNKNRKRILNKTPYFLSNSPLWQSLNTIQYSFWFLTSAIFKNFFTSLKAKQNLFPACSKPLTLIPFLLLQYFLFLKTCYNRNLSPYVQRGWNQSPNNYNKTVSTSKPETINLPNQTCLESRKQEREKRMRRGGEEGREEREITGKAH